MESTLKRFTFTWLSTKDHKSETQHDRAVVLWEWHHYTCSLWNHSIMAWIGRDLEEHLVPANIASISGSPPGTVLTRAFLSPCHNSAESSDMWAHWCDSGKEGRRQDILMQYLRSVSRAHQGIQVLQGFMLDWHIFPLFLWDQRERDQCWL